MIAQILVDISSQAIDRFFDYLVPDRLVERVSIGSIVLVPFNKREEIGMVVGFISTPKEGVDLLSVTEVITTDPVFDETMIKLCQTISERYIAPLSESLKLALPPGPKIKLDKIISIDNDLKTDLLGELERELLTSLNEAKDRSSLKSLIKTADPKLLSALKKTGHIKTEYRLLRPRRAVKIVEAVELNVSKEEAAFLETGLEKTAPKQAKIISILRTQGKLVSSELLLKSGSSRASLLSLAKKNVISLKKKEEAPKFDHFFPQDFKGDLTLNDEQALALTCIFDSLATGIHKSMLLEGVTASGKTEIYLRAVERALELEKTALVLVPEISLTPQIAHRFNLRFKGEVAILHSGLTQIERYDQWHRIKAGERRVVLGARSALFAPLKNLGLIIVDEEHEPAYKQNSTPRYHGIFVAKKRAELSSALLILGSATPSMESRYMVERGGCDLLRLTKRAMTDRLPKIEIIDMRLADERRGGVAISPPLASAITEAIDDGKKAIIFLNRRGYFGFILCKDCGYVFKCKNCDVTLVYHAKEKSLICHHCGYATRPKGSCPSCAGSKMGFYSLGTEMVERELNKLFPKTTTIRMDRDSTRAKGSHKDNLAKFARGGPAILLGTQMIAKGLDFPDVSLVGVINADTSLHIPDFRSEERTFQLLMQISGRAGRSEMVSRVIIQTFSPDSFALKAISEYDYESFYVKELATRRDLLYPPFSEMANIVFSSKKHDLAVSASNDFFAQVNSIKDEGFDFDLLGPAPCPIGRIAGLYRIHMIIKTPNLSPVLPRLKDLFVRFNSRVLSKDVKIIIDVDPVWML